MDYSTLLQAPDQSQWSGLTPQQKMALLLSAQQQQGQQQMQAPQQQVNPGGAMSPTQGAAQLVQAVIAGRRMQEQRAQQAQIQQLLMQQQMPMQLPQTALPQPGAAADDYASI